MSDLAKLKKKAAELEQRRQFDKALAVYEEMLLAQEGSDDADVSLLNRVGDLRVRLGQGAEALDAYERAVELYVERGFLNNAIALCNKILRQDPTRAEVHYRLGRISAEKGFRSDARRHFLDYAALMQRAGRLDEAFRALQEFVDLSPENADVRLVLAEQLAKHGRTADAVAQLTLLLERYEIERRYDEAEEIAERIRALDPDFAAPAHGDVERAENGSGDGYRPYTTPARPHTPSRPANAMPDLVLIEPTEFGSAPAGEAGARPAQLENAVAASETLIRDEALELANDLPSSGGSLGDGGQGADVASVELVELVEGLTGTGELSADVSSDLTLTDGLTPTLDGFEATGLAAPEMDAQASHALADGALEIEPTSIENPGFESGSDVTASTHAPLGGVEPVEPVELVSGDAAGDVFGDAGIASVDTYTAADLAISLPGDDSSARVTADGTLDLATDGNTADVTIDGDAIDGDLIDADGSSTAEIPYLVDFDGDEAGVPEAGEPTSMPTLESVRETPAAPASSSFLSFDEEPASGDDSFINLGDLLRAEEGPRSTRMVTEEKAPTGDEQADFAEMLRKFKQGVAENVDEEDYESHHDLGVAYLEMGLIDEAIAEFQRALRGTPHRARTYEALGQCFLDREQYAIAASVLQRALAEPGADDQKLVGVLYLLGRAAEEMNQRNEALSYYQRVFAVDIEFADVAKRMDMAVQVTR